MKQLASTNSQDTWSSHHLSARRLRQLTGVETLVSLVQSKHHSILYFCHPVLGDKSTVRAGKGFFSSSISARCCWVTLHTIHSVPSLPPDCSRHRLLKPPPHSLLLVPLPDLFIPLPGLSQKNPQHL